MSSGILNIINPNYTLGNFTNYVLAPKQYFQYRVLMESDDESATPTFPSLTSIDFETKYFGGKPTVVTNLGQAFTSLSGFNITQTGTCTPKFQLGLSPTDCCYWNSSSWVNAINSPANEANTNTQAEVTAAISQFVADQGVGSMYIRAFLSSDTDQACSLDKI